VVGTLYLCETDGLITNVTKKTMPVTQSSEVLEKCKRQLMEYFNHQRKQFDVPMSLNGTDFQKAVWSAMLKIEYGTCVSYKKLAEMAGYPNAVRAAGTACGLNPIAIMIPCHRIIKADGNSGNYAWGSEMKQFLIELEREK
jgi:methylated-DNA-[protein]-cysteine S-methyltransferase